MTPFRNPVAIERSLARIAEAAGGESADWLPKACEDAADPDLAVLNFERWIEAASSPTTQLAFLSQNTALAHVLCTIMGSSQSMADAVVQNPELASLILDPSQLARAPSRDELLREGAALVRVATSQTHGLDRLRFLKQRWMLPIVVNDLLRQWPPETVWLALSDLADALITLTVEMLWTGFAAERGLDTQCPVAVVAFGKLGGRELNYSSDVDLAYVVSDHVDEATLKALPRFCESLSRALADRMGRGNLYRVDLRLRPFGGAGAIVRSMLSYEEYYRLYAELWEKQALLRSRLVCGPSEIGERWESLVSETCYQPSWSQMVLEELLATRMRIEAYAGDNDIKRGEGGIRDIEFLAQLLQMLNGFQHPEIRAAATTESIQRLIGAGILSSFDGSRLIDAYTLFRTVEHRIQLFHDRQSHTLPTNDLERRKLATLCSFATWEGLHREVDACRSAVRSIFRRFFSPALAEDDPRTQIAALLHEDADAVFRWFERLPEANAFLRLLVENESSLARARKTVVGAPIAISRLRESVSVTEHILSGEIEEDDRPDLWIATAPIESLATVAANAELTVLLRFTLGISEHPEVALAAIYDALLIRIAHEIDAPFDIVALGSYATGQLSFWSDADVILLCAPDVAHATAERKGQQLLARVNELHRMGSPLQLDLRLRPEGNQGLLVRSDAGLENYARTEMELWERFALGQTRLVAGRPGLDRRLRRFAFELPLTPERLRELLAMKQRIEFERTTAKYRRRHVKVGFGGLSDLDWMVQLMQMRYPSATRAIDCVDFSDRVDSLVRARLMTGVEAHELLEARNHLLNCRNRLYALGFERDVIPENPDKLDKLAWSLGMSEGNAFLSYHEQVINRVRGMFEESMERLGA